LWIGNRRTSGCPAEAGLKQPLVVAILFWYLQKLMLAGVKELFLVKITNLVLYLCYYFYPSSINI